MQQWEYLIVFANDPVGGGSIIRVNGQRWPAGQTIPVFSVKMGGKVGSLLAHGGKPVGCSSF